MRFSLHPEAETDLREAAAFYRKQAGTNLAQSFLAEFERAVDLLLEYPGLGAPWRCGKRRFFMKRFPYSVIYDTAGDELRIFAVAHHSRHPDYWRGRS
jgi:toxin ParE1/3/4